MSYLVGLTPAGIEVLKIYSQAHAALEKKLFAGISEERRESCMQVLLEMEANLK